MNLEKHNPHWKEDYFYQFPLFRNLYDTLTKNVGNRQIITISGMRRTGKTVLLKQIINLLVQEEGVKRTHILYYSFDEEQPSFEELVEEFLSIMRIDKEKTKIYLFLDEVQKLDNWQNQIKYYYDNFPVKVFVSGSSSLFIRKKVTESLAGRSFDFNLPPLSFREFLLFRNKVGLLKEKNIFPRELQNEFTLYQKRQFIEVINEDEEYISNYVKSILEKVVYIDIPKVFPIENHDLLVRLLRIIASNPGMIIEYESLAMELGINRITLSNYLFYLEEAFLIRKIYNFSGNRLTSEKKSKKFYLSTTSFFPYLNPSIEETKLVENLIVVEANAKFFWRTPYKDEIDIVVEKGEYAFPIEVKYKKMVVEKDSKTIKKFLAKNNAKEGVVVTKGQEFEHKQQGMVIRFIPAWKFLLYSSP